jgi:hypothetical protein
MKSNSWKKQTVGVFVSNQSKEVKDLLFVIWLGVTVEILNTNFNINSSIPTMCDVLRYEIRGWCRTILDVINHNPNDTAYKTHIKATRFLTHGILPLSRSLPWSGHVSFDIEKFSLLLPECEQD